MERSSGLSLASLVTFPTYWAHAGNAGANATDVHAAKINPTRLRTVRFINSRSVLRNDICRPPRE
jgi:hypothetical protein